MTENQSYEPPSLTRIGSLHELTLQLSNKDGLEPDFVTPIVPSIVGSLEPAS